LNVEYRNVKKDPRDLEEMLRHSAGVREVPVILREGKVEVGWMGRS
jgi:hypothetical protein